MPLRHRLAALFCTLLLALAAYACDSSSDATVEIPADSPIAQLLIAPLNPLPGQTITIDASGSTDEGGIARFEFTLRDAGGKIVALGSGELPTFTFQSVPGKYSATVLLTDGDGNQSQKTVNFTISVCGPEPTIITGAMPNATEGQPYEATLTAGGLFGAATFGLQEGAELPEGLTLSPEGVLSGTPFPETEGAYVLRLELDDACPDVPRAIPFSISLTIDPPLPVPCDVLNIETESLPAGFVGSPYSFTLETSGGQPPIDVEFSGGNIPAGMLWNNKVLTGVPTIASIYVFQVRATDSCELGIQEDFKTYSLFVF